MRVRTPGSSGFTLPTCRTPSPAGAPIAGLFSDASKGCRIWRYRISSELHAGDNATEAEWLAELGD